MPSLASSGPAGRSWFRRLEIWSVALALAGAGIAGYLTIVHYRESLLVCSGISDCETVQNSEYAEVAGIPVALLGLLMFVAMLGLAVVRMMRPELADAATMAIFVMVVAGIGFYIYLTYLELFVINAICQWCVASSLVTIGLLITESLMLRRMLTMTES
jgi:uncharacterized membrane protein